MSALPMFVPNNAPAADQLTRIPLAGHRGSGLVMMRTGARAMARARRDWTGRTG